MVQWLTVYSTLLKEAIVITNRHAVQNCSNKIFVRARHDVDIPIFMWLVPAGNVDIAIGLLARPPPIPSLYMTSKEDVVPGVHISAMSLQAPVVVAPDARLPLSEPRRPISCRRTSGIAGLFRYRIRRNIECGACGAQSSAALRSDGNEQKVARFSVGGLKGMRQARIEAQRQIRTHTRELLLTH